MRRKIEFKPAVTTNPTQGFRLELPVLYHWHMTTEEQPAFLDFVAYYQTSATFSVSHMWAKNWRL